LKLPASTVSLQNGSANFNASSSLRGAFAGNSSLAKCAGYATLPSQNFINITSADNLVIGGVQYTGAGYATNDGSMYYMVAKLKQPAGTQRPSPALIFLHNQLATAAAASGGSVTSSWNQYDTFYHFLPEVTARCCKYQ